MLFSQPIRPPQSIVHTDAPILPIKTGLGNSALKVCQHELGKSIKTPPNLNKEYLTPSEVAELLNIGRTSIYRYIRNGTIKVIRFERKTLVRRANIENMTDYLSPENEKTPTKRNPLSPTSIPLPK